MDDSMFLNTDDYLYDNSINDDLNITISDSEESIDLVITDENHKLDSKSRIAMINNRSYINKLKENVDKKYQKLEQMRDEMKLCENHISELIKEETTTTAEIEKNRNNENIATVFRLQGQLKRIQIELDGEKELRKLISDKVTKAEQEYIQSQLEEGKIVLDELNLKKEEELYDKNKMETIKQRLNKEKILTDKALKCQEIDRRNISLIEKEKQQQILMTKESVKNAHLRHSKFLTKTIDKDKETKKQLEKEKHEKKNQKEIQFQKLNSEVTLIKENLSAIKAKRDADLIIAKQAEMELRTSVIQKGGNPNLEVKIKKKQIQIEKIKEQFNNSVKDKQLKIADKIISEEDNMKRKKKLMPLLFPDQMKPMKIYSKNELTKMAMIKNDLKEDVKLDELEDEEKWNSWNIRSDAGESSINEDMKNLSEVVNFNNSMIKKSNNLQNVNIDMNIPEFEGLWDTTVNYKVPKNNTKQFIKTENASKMDQDIMNRVLHQLKENIIKPQIVNGKVFKGHSFQSKPEIIMFENLEVDKQYQQKIVLTNTSYCTNQCRFEYVSENLLDFINIKFSPAGPLSPGMTCEFTIFFEPKLDQDLFGEVYFTCQSEKFSIPIQCLTKKCKMLIDNQLIKFDTIVIGEKVVQSIKLKNSGAKGTYTYMKKKFLSDSILSNKDGESVTEDCLEIKLDDDVTEDQSITTSMDNVKLWINPYEEQEIMVKWSPMVAGDYLEDYFIRFDDIDNKGFDLRVLGRAIDVPVYIENPNISMDICMMDRLYQDTIIFKSRAATALKLNFHVPNEMKDYLEILPNSGFIQAGQSFKAQIKLLVRPSIYKENCSYLDQETGILEVPITTLIANQVKTVDFTLQAILTGTDLEIIIPDNNSNLLNFGYCTIKESKIKTIQLVNKSILCQEFGFTGYPDYIEIQPHHGYGIILPKETIELQIIFSPLKADNFKFDLRCQTIIDRSFTVCCIGIGVHPLLDISTQILSFPQTAINDRSKMEIFIENNHMSTNIYTHEPPRIGVEPVAPVGCKTFQFIIPEDIPIFIHPRFGSLNAGQKQKVTVFFEPKLVEDLIKVEASNNINKKLQITAKEKWEEEIKILHKQKQNEDEQDTKLENKSQKKSAKKSNRPPSDKNKNMRTEDEVIAEGPLPIHSVMPDDIKTNSDEYLKGKLSLLQKFEFNFELIKIKCLIADGDIADRSNNIVYNPVNTLFLEAHCPSVKPDLIILSNSGKSIIDFGESIINKRVTKVISIQNISPNEFQVKSTLLDPNGAFQICNAVRKLSPNTVQNILIAFNPTEEGFYQSDWSIFGKEEKKILKFTFKAKAIIPNVEFKELLEGKFNAGTVLVNEFCEKPLTIVNHSNINIDYKFSLLSQLDMNSNIFVRNKNGMSVFNIVPHKGNIAPGKTQIVTITFSPDHINDNYKEIVKCFLFENVELTNFILHGEAKTNIMYLKNQSEMSQNKTEYLGQTWTNEQPKSDDIVADEMPLMDDPLIVQAAYSDDGILQEGKCTFLIGCVRTSAVSQKKNGEFSIDNLNMLIPLGFNVEPNKGQVEAESEKTIIITWNPAANYEMGSVISSSLLVTLKGESCLTRSIEIRGFVL